MDSREDGPYVAQDATVFTAMAVAEGARVEDVDEWLGGTGRHPVDGMRHALFAAVSLRVVCYQPSSHPELPLVLYGVEATDEPGVGNVWLIATDYAPQHAFSMHRLLEPELEAFLALYPTLTAVADQRNKLHHKWMEWLGFRKVGVVTTGPEPGMPCFVYQITRNPPDVCSSSPRPT